MWAEVGAEHGPAEGRLLTQSTTHVWPRAAELTFARLPICPSAHPLLCPPPLHRQHAPYWLLAKRSPCTLPLLLCHCRCQCQCLTPTLAKVLLPAQRPLQPRFPLSLPMRVSLPRPAPDRQICISLRKSLGVDRWNSGLEAGRGFRYIGSNSCHSGKETDKL